MIKSIRSWSFLLLIPLILGTVIYFLIPLQFILTGFPKIQQTFNTYNLEIEQNSIRSVTFMNGKVIRNIFQSYQNLQNMLIRGFKNANNYETVKHDINNFNSAYELASINQSQKSNTILSKTMWFTGHTEIREEDYPVFYKYAQIQEQIKNIFESPVYGSKGIRKLEWNFFFKSHSYYFAYPSESSPKFSSLQNSVLTPNFNLSFLNFQQRNGTKVTMVDQKGQTLILNSVIFEDDSLIGVLVMHLDLQTVIKKIIEFMRLPQFQNSVSVYYFLRPIYAGDHQSQPQIIANFSSKNTSNISIPINQYLNLSKEDITPKLFSSNENYQLFIQRNHKSDTQYVVPIYLFNYQGQSEICLNLYVFNNFHEIILDEKYLENIKIAIIVPSVFFLFLTTILAGAILRYHLLRLQAMLRGIVNYCSLINKGDLDIQVEYNHIREEDARQLYIELADLNRLNKFSDMKFYDVPKPERIGRYLKAFNFFSQYGYNKSNLCENLADCYHSMNEFERSIEFINLALEEDWLIYQQIENQYWKGEKHYEELDYLKKNVKKKLSKRLFKKIQYIYLSCQGNFSDFSVQQITYMVKQIKSLAYLRSSSPQFIMIQIIKMKIFLYRREYLPLIKSMKNLEKLIAKYEEKHQDSYENSEYPSDILRSQFNCICGSYNEAIYKYIQAYNCYVQALCENYYDPRLQQQVIKKLQILLQNCGISSSSLIQLYSRNQIIRREREYIFLIDNGNPGLDAEEKKQWKKNSREISEEIFNKYITNSDRVCINQFCSHCKVVCYLVGKQYQEKLLKKQMFNCFKCPNKKIYSDPKKGLEGVIRRVEHLQSQKYFIIFLKDQDSIDFEGISILCDSVANSKFLFITQNENLNFPSHQKIYWLSSRDSKNIQRILQQKSIKFADNKLYLF